MIACVQALPEKLEVKLPTTVELNPAAPTPIDRIALLTNSHDNVTQRKHNSQIYSRFVNFMKFVLPALAFIVIALIAAWPQINNSDLGFRIGVTLMKLTGDENPSMINPRYIGTDSDNQPFSITADLARNINDDNMRVNLVMPKADITLGDGTWVVLTANDGIYYKEQNKLELKGAVNLYHDSGYEFLTERASIDLETGSAKSHGPVKGQGPFGHVNASGFHMIAKGKIIYLLGKSKLVLFPGTKPLLK